MYECAVTQCAQWPSWEVLDVWMVGTTLLVLYDVIINCVSSLQSRMVSRSSSRFGFENMAAHGQPVLSVRCSTCVWNWSASFRSVREFWVLLEYACDSRLGVDVEKEETFLNPDNSWAFEELALPGLLENWSNFTRKFHVSQRMSIPILSKLAQMHSAELVRFMRFLFFWLRSNWEVDILLVGMSFCGCNGVQCPDLLALSVLLDRWLALSLWLEPLLCSVELLLSFVLLISDSWEHRGQKFRGSTIPMCPILTSFSSSNNNCSLVATIPRLIRIQSSWLTSFSSLELEVSCWSYTIKFKLGHVYYMN